MSFLMWICLKRMNVNKYVLNHKPWFSAILCIFISLIPWNAAHTHTLTLNISFLTFKYFSHIINRFTKNLKGLKPPFEVKKSLFIFQKTIILILEII